MQIKIITVLFFAFFLGINVSAQSWLSLYDEADSLIAIGKYPAALTVAKKALNQAEIDFGRNHPKYAQTIGCIGRIYVYAGDYTNSEKYFLTSLDLYKKINNDRDSNYVEVIGNLGQLYQIKGDFNRSENFYVEALNLQERITGKENKRYLNMWGNLGNLYVVTANYEKAEPVLLSSLRLKEKVFGKQHTSYVSALNSLGAMYSRKENYTLAEQYLQEARSIRQKALGANHPLIAPILDNLGYLFLQQGAYEYAGAMFKQATTIYEKRTPGAQAHLKSLNNTAVCYVNLKQPIKADSLYRKVLVIMGEKLGVNHPDYAAVLDNLGVVVERQGKTEEALNLYQQAINIYSFQKGEAVNLSANVLNDIGETYANTRQLDKADSVYRVALSIHEKLLGKNSLTYAGTLNNRAALLIQKNQIDSAALATATVQLVIRQNLNRNFLYQTARQKESLLNKWAPSVRSSFALAQRYPQRSDAAQLAFSGTLFLKNLLLSQYIGLLGNETQTADAKLQLLTDTLRQVSNQVAAQYALPIAQRKNLDSLETRAETLEKDLARQSAPFRQAQQALQVTWENVRDALKPTEAAVEFVSFPHLNRGQETDTVSYLALVLRPGDKAPRVVPLLTDEAPLRRLLARRKGATLYATRGSELDSDQLSQGDSLYQLVWQPIDSLLSGVKTVYLSPSGLLHQVAFAALPYPNANPKGGSFLADRYQLRQVGSTRQVAQTNPTDDTYQRLTSAQLYGGIQYDSAGRVSARTGGWPFLPGTAREVSEIGAFIGAKATTTTGAAATETEFKKQSGHSPAVLHVATHGFVFPDPAVSTPDSSAGGWAFQRIANPLFRTGLLMAGANRVWQGGRPALGEDDGILTAYEVANLNLTGTKLVVLSACETALGDIRGSEGVFGLQRAFKMAGAGYLLTSLWPVSDETTSTLMTQFYRNWKKYKTIRAAFQQTQQQMRQKYPPSVWAAFVLIE